MTDILQTLITWGRALLERSALISDFVFGTFSFLGQNFTIIDIFFGAGFIALIGWAILKFFSPL